MPSPFPPPNTVGTWSRIVREAADPERAEILADRHGPALTRAIAGGADLSGWPMDQILRWSAIGRSRSEMSRNPSLSNSQVEELLTSATTDMVFEYDPERPEYWGEQVIGALLSTGRIVPADVHDQILRLLDDLEAGRRPKGVDANGPPAMEMHAQGLFRVLWHYGRLDWDLLWRICQRVDERMGTPAELFPLLLHPSLPARFHQWGLENGGPPVLRALAANPTVQRSAAARDELFRQGAHDLEILTSLLPVTRPHAFVAHLHDLLDALAGTTRVWVPEPLTFSAVLRYIDKASPAQRAALDDGILSKLLSVPDRHDRADVQARLREWKEAS